MSEKFDVVIIGAGLSGLLSASLLSRKGLKICVLEKNNEIGGMIQPFKRNGILFDTGMNFFGAWKKGQIQNELFKIFGISDDLSVSEISEFELILNNKSYLIPNNFTAFKNRLFTYFPEEKKGIEMFISGVKEIFDNLMIENIYSNKNLQKYYSESASEFIERITKNKELQNVLKFNRLLFGNNFDTVPLYIYAAITGSFLQSAGMFTGGTKHFIDILRNKIYENEGFILTKKAVSELKSEKNKITHCICRDGSEYYADYFLSSLHPQLLLPKIKSDVLKKFYRKRILNLPNSNSVLMINVLLKDKKIVFDDKPKFINSYNNEILFYYPVSGKTENYATTVKIMCKDDINDYRKWQKTKTGKRGEEYKKYKNEKAETLFSVIEKIIPGFRDAVIKYFVSTPLTFIDFTGSPDGSAYGLLKKSDNFSESMIPVNTKFENLFLTGQSINFHGLSGVSVTTLLACSAITKTMIID